MKWNQWMGVAAWLAAIGVGLGAFGAHGLEARLTEADGVANWETGVDYHVWHALALLVYGLFGRETKQPAFVGWCFLIGVLFFSGSLYLLSLDIASSVVWPFTPLGGTLFLIGWIGWAVACMRGPEEISD